MCVRGARTSFASRGYRGGCSSFSLPTRAGVELDVWLGVCAYTATLISFFSKKNTSAPTHPHTQHTPFTVSFPVPVSLAGGAEPIPCDGRRTCASVVEREVAMVAMDYGTGIVAVTTKAARSDVRAAARNRAPTIILNLLALLGRKRPAEDLVCR